MNGCRLLCEVHESFQTNIDLAKRGFWVYDFALPLLVLHAFNFHTAKNLRHWLSICPKRQITVLDTHDGTSHPQAPQPHLPHIPRVH